VTRNVSNKPATISTDRTCFNHDQKHQNLNITSPANAARSEPQAKSGVGLLAHFDLSHSSPAGMRQRAV
jgi:hypothetical protein